jgi:hypothetical protein
MENVNTANQKQTQDQKNQNGGSSQRISKGNESNQEKQF